LAFTDNVNRVRIVDGVFRIVNKVRMEILSCLSPSRLQDTPCKLKIAFNESQWSRLEREATILRTIRTNDLQCKHPQHIVTWLYPDRFLTQESDNLYLINEQGDFTTSPSPMKSLVFESGGANLKQFLSNKSRFSVHVAQRVHILEEIVEALNFLHGLNIVHFDVKPENIVCFSSASGSDLRWKLIDFDSSYDVTPRDSPSPMISFSSLSSNDPILVTKEYTSPEVMKVLNDRSADRDPHPSGAPVSIPVAGIPGLAPVDVEVSWRLDIWSLGLVAVFLFSGHSLWEALHPTRPFQHSMVSGASQPQIQLLLSRSFGHKEKSFLEACLQVKSADRKPASELLAKSLFKTDNSTTLRLSSDSMSQRFADLEDLLSRYREESQSLVCDELEDKFSDFSLFLSNQLERVHHLSPEERKALCTSL
jgi:serine/threonine protein kinase